MAQKPDFSKSIERFARIDRNNFHFPTADAELSVGRGRLLEYRVRIEDDKPCIIEFYPDGKGYAIYVQESN